MQAVLLAGGLGTRLRSQYPDRPKALVPIAGKPFLEWQMEWLARGGVSDVHIAAGHLAEVLVGWLAGRPESALRITLSAEPAPLGTAGGLRYVEPHLRSDPFLVLNGDSLLPNLDFQSLEKTAADFPMIGKSGAVLAVTCVNEAGRYGTVEFDDAGLVTAFREKARRKAGWINGGVYLMRRAILNSIEPGKNLSIETDIFPELALAGLLGVFRAEPPLLDMGTPEGITAMESFLAGGAARP